MTISNDLFSFISSKDDLTIRPSDPISLVAVKVFRSIADLNFVYREFLPAERECLQLLKSQNIDTALELAKRDESQRIRNSLLIRIIKVATDYDHVDIVGEAMEAIQGEEVMEAAMAWGALDGIEKGYFARAKAYLSMIKSAELVELIKSQLKKYDPKP